MKRILSSLVLLVFAFGTCALGAKRNIILFVTDDQSPDCGCYGNKVIKTPHMDALAADGTLFTDAFATTASCSASRSVILTGLHNHATGQYGHEHDFHKFASWPRLLSLPVALGNLGYRTIQIGKYHVAPEEVYHFQTYLRGNARNAVQMANVCEEVIREDSSKPFFIYFATSDPHRGGGRASDEPLAADLFGNKKNRGSHQGINEVFYKPEEVIVPPFLPDTKECREEIAQYYQSISRIDQGLGRLVQILKDAGKYDDTLIVFTSDHGMAFPAGKTTVYEGGLQVPFLVRNPYNEKRGVRANAMISHVDITPSLVDFAGGYDPGKRAAKAKAVGDAFTRKVRPRENASRVFKSFHGRSWIPVLDKENAEGWDEIGASHTFHEIQMYYPMRVFRDRKYKLIWNIAHGLEYPFASDLWAASTWQGQFKKGMDAPYGFRTVGSYINRPEFELYDVSKFPAENDNLAANPDHAEVLEEYKQKLKDLQKKTRDPWIMKWRYE